MAIIAKNEGGDFKQAKPGTYAARCYSIIDLGTQHSEYQGEEFIKRQVLVGWEIPTELMDDGQPISISKFYTLSLHEKANLCIDLQSWRGREFTEQEKDGFDITKLLGVPCMISIIHNEKGKARITSISTMPKGLEIQDAINPKFEFSLDEYLAGDTTAWDNISDGIKGIIQKCEELNKDKKSNDPFAAPADFGDVPVDEQIPF